MVWKNSIRSQVIFWCDTFVTRNEDVAFVSVVVFSPKYTYRMDDRRRCFVRIVKCGNHWYPRNRRWRVIGRGVNCKSTSNLVIRRVDGMLINITESSCKEGKISEWPFDVNSAMRGYVVLWGTVQILASQNYRALTQISENIQTLCSSVNNKIQKSILDINSAGIGYVWKQFCRHWINDVRSCDILSWFRYIFF